MVELLAPAGNLEKLKFAIYYGADAVFIGGKSFSLRANASNFTFDDLVEASNFVHSHGKKIYVTTNVIPHHADMEGLLPYLKELEEAKIDGIIAASPYIIDTALKHTNLEVHISTQQSAMNVNTVNFWEEKGASRVVLARDLTLEEIEHIMKNVSTEIEIFIHGGMCAGFSGRCSLSNHLTNRDANRGGCAHTCRWIYDLVKKQKEKEASNFTIQSKDLSSLSVIPALIDLKVNSLKIEGRMKSLHYIATVVKTYRMLIDEYKKEGFIKDYSFYEKQLEKAENRPSSIGFFEGLPTKDEQLFIEDKTPLKQNFVGVIKDYDKENGFAYVETRNVIKLGDTLEVFSPNKDDFTFNNSEMYDSDNNLIDRAYIPKSIIKIKVPYEVTPNDILRIMM